MQERIDTKQPLFDQSTFIGRWRHFAAITSPRLAFVPTAQLEAARDALQDYESGRKEMSTEEVRSAMALTQSAFHPDSGELQNVIGRMSFQVPGGTILIGAMMIFYKSTPAVVFWQWANQSFNALVNYTNRNAKSELTSAQIGKAYVTATSAALCVSLGLKRLCEKRGLTAGVAGRLVPLAAVLSANCVNIPLMRQAELRKGIPVEDETGTTVATSKAAARKAVGLVCITRNILVTPPMVLVPLVMSGLERASWWARLAPKANLPLQLYLSSVIIYLMLPIGCAIFPQRSSITGAQLESSEPEVFEDIVKKTGKNRQDLHSSSFYFNKGL